MVFPKEFGQTFDSFKMPDEFESYGLQNQCCGILRQGVPFNHYPILVFKCTIFSRKKTLKTFETLGVKTELNFKSTLVQNLIRTIDLNKN